MVVVVVVAVHMAMAVIESVVGEARVRRGCQSPPIHNAQVSLRQLTEHSVASHTSSGKALARGEGAKRGENP